MASQKMKTTNIRSYKTKQEMNIGILIFTIVLLYLIFTIFTYATSKQITPYEVRRGSIVRDNSYTGLILRQEMTVHAESDGYVIYFQSENSKVKSGSNVYAISPQKIEMEVQNPEEKAVSAVPEEEEQKNRNLRIQKFNENFDPQKFSAVYTLKNEFTEALRTTADQSKMLQLDAVAADQNLKLCPSTRDGILVRTLDGFETLTEDTLKPSDFDRSNYDSVRMEDQMEIHTGDPVYKLITSEDWAVYVELEKNTARELSGTDFVKIRIDKDNETIWADFSILQLEGNYYGKLMFDNSVIRYTEERYLNIELILEDESGLKIPKSAAVEKGFYVVPAEYVAIDETSGASGLMIQKEGEVYFQKADIYEQTEDGEVYLNTDDFERNTVAVHPKSGETCTLKEKKTLKGVYNINKGYAVFRRIIVLCENDDYYIVAEETPYGLSDYDHIILDGSTVEDEEVVFQ